MKIGLVGLGLIGTGWARLVASKGWEVALFDAEFERVERVAAELEGATAVRRCRTLADAVDGVDYVQESLPEAIDVKRAIFAELDALAAPEVVLGSSASSFPMSQIATEVQRPERCIVAHPMNPPDLIPVVEVVPGPATSTATLERTRQIMQALDRVVVECEREIAGFVINRLQCALEREAFALVHSGAVSAAAVELAIKDGLGPRWAALGPFGVEATNGETLKATFEKFAGYFAGMFDELHDSFDGLDGQGRFDRGLVDAFERGVAEVYGTSDSDTLRAYRDEALRATQDAVRQAFDRNVGPAVAGARA